MKHDDTKPMKDSSKLKPDPVLKDYWRNNSRFSDLFNQIFFNGKESIKPDKLSDEDTEESSVIMEKGQTTSITRTRDIIKQYEDGAELVLIGLENQMKVHYAMPVRSMLYDSLRYTRQCKELEQKNRADNNLKSSDEFLSGIAKSDRIKPVITLVVYYGEKEWDGPIYLSDMMDIPPLFEKFYNNQGIHLLQVRNAANLLYQFKNQDNRDFFTMIGEFYNNNGNIDLNTFKEKYPNLEIYWETLAAIGAATSSTQLVDYAHEHKGGSIVMCTALDNLKKEGIREGKAEGKAESLIGQITAKHSKGLSVATISEHLEVTEKEVTAIVRIIRQYPDVSVEELTKEYLKMTKV